MFGFGANSKKERLDDIDNRDIAKLFFNSFSKRVGTVEESLQKLAIELEKVKVSMDHSQVSDLVLLDRLQKAEKMIRDSLSAIKTTVERAPMLETASRMAETPLEVQAGVDRIVAAPAIQAGSLIAPRVLSPTGETGSLQSITTPTELQVLTLLVTEGPKSAPEIGRVVGRSREHTARLMKKLFEGGYIRRDQTRIPFRYSAVDRLKQTVTKPEPKGEEKKPISVRQT